MPPAPSERTPVRRSVRYPVPPLATDCHMHVFGPPDRYPAAASRSYMPPEASLAAWRAVAEPIGLQRLVVVQPSAYGTDNACTLDALRAFGPAARGIAVIDAGTPDAALRDMHAAGVRGVRLNPKSAGQLDARDMHALILRMAERIAPLGWHVQVYADREVLLGLVDAIRAAPVPVVLDHMAGARAGDGEAELRPLLDLLARGQCWAKLSGAYRVSRHDDDFGDSTPVARMLVRANPDNLVWGTDWPHVASHPGQPQASPPPATFRDLDAAGLLDLLAEAAGNEATFGRILAQNPARLYDY